MAPLGSKSVSCKVSFLNIISFRSVSDTRPSTSHSTDTNVSRSGLREAPARLRALYEGTLRDTLPAFHITTHTQPAPTQSCPPISKLAKSFSDSLTTLQLSKFLTWFLYYDIVELPASPETWYAPFDNMEIRGWIALGEFLSKVKTAGYGLDLVVLDSVCDRLKVYRPTVHAMIIRFANPDTMAFTQVGTVVRTAEAAGKSALEVLDAVQDQLVVMRRLASNLKPEEDSMHELWRQLVLKRLRGLSTLVVAPQIRHLRFKAPLVLASTADQLPQEFKDGIALKFRYEAIQLERRVPLARYGIPDSPRTPPTQAAKADVEPSDEPASDTTKDPAHPGVNLSSTGALLREIRHLRSTVARLTREKHHLVSTNLSLALRVVELIPLEPCTLLPPSLRDSPPPPPAIFLSAPVPTLDPSPFPRPTSPAGELLQPPFIPPIPRRSSRRPGGGADRGNRRSGFVSYGHLIASVEAGEFGTPPSRGGEWGKEKEKEKEE